MKGIKFLISSFMVVAALLITLSNADAAVWNIGNAYDGATIDDKGISTATNLPYGVTDWVIKYGPISSQTYNPMFREWFWYRIGTTGKQTSFDKLPVTGTEAADFTSATLNYTGPGFIATVNFSMGTKAAPSYNSAFIKTITIQNTTASPLDYHLFTYSDLDISSAGTDNVAIIKGERAIQTGFEGHTLVQTSTLKPSHYDIDTLGSGPGSMADSLENGTDPIQLADFSGPYPQDGDMQFVFGYDLTIPANGSVTFTVTDTIVQTKPMTITNSQTGGSCADYGGNVTYNICFDNLTNTTVNATNVVVTADIYADNQADPTGSISFVSATNGGVYDPTKKLISWTFPSVAAKAASQCVQATVGVNTTKAFTPTATIFSDETFPATVSIATPLCNYPPTVTSAPKMAYTGVQYSYQITATDTEKDPLTFTLTQAPSGLTMNSSGLITWTPTSQQGNLSYPVKVDISDGHSVVHYTFSIYVQWQNQSPSAPAQQTANAVVNQPMSYQVLAIDPDNQALTFTTADTLPAGLTLSAGGLLSGTPTAVGTYTVNVTVTDSSQAAISTALTINVTTATTKQNPVITWANPAAITYGTALSATQLNATANVPGSFTYTPASGVLGAGAQTLSVVFTPTDTTTYNTATATVSLTVNKAAATVTLGALSQTYSGTAKSATVTTNPAGLSSTITYAGSATAPTAAGTYAVVATISDANYTGSATGTLTIAKATPTITWAAPAAIYLGTTLSSTQLNATASVAGSFVYTPAAGTVMNTAGANTLSAAFTPTDTANYNNASATVSITVNSKQNPVITWANPADITYGTLLSATQLNATVDVTAGTLTYSPASGTKLNAGSSLTLSVTFTPTDTTNYNTVTKSVTINVTKAAATVSLTGLSTTLGTTVTAANPSGGLTAIYDGTPKVVTVATSPAGLTVALTYNGSSTAPTDAGSYAVVATITDPNYTGSASGTLVIAKASATVTLGSLSQSYDGTAKSATATTTPSGKTVTFTYNGSSTAPTAVGSYTVVGTVSDANYSGSATGTMTIANANATVTLAGLSATYDGNAKSITATTSPAGKSVVITYNGSTTAPTAVGSYAVIATITDPNYSGSASDTLVIAKATQSIGAITFSAQTLNTGGTTTASAKASSGLPIVFSTSTPNTCSVGSSTGVVTAIAAGTCTITANQAGDTNYNPASQVTKNITVTDLTTTTNLPPEFTSTPVVTAYHEGYYYYPVSASDPNGSTIVFSLTTRPSGMNINSSTGLIYWHPSEKGSYSVTVKATDSTGLSATQSFRVTVTDPSRNYSPRFTSTPLLSATVAEVYSYTAKAVDTNGDAVYYRLSTAPSGMAIDLLSGLITWTPQQTDLNKINSVKIEAVDSKGGRRTQSFTITVSGPAGTTDNAPIFTSNPIRSAVSGKLYTYTATATDPEGSNVSYSLTTKPDGMNINSSTGQVTWTPRSNGTYSVSIKATDSDGTYSTQTFTIMVGNYYSGASLFQALSTFWGQIR